MKRVVVALGVGLAVLVVGFTAVSAAGVLVRQDETRTVALSQVPTAVTLRTGAGPVEVDAGTQATVHWRSTWSFARPNVRMSWVGRALTVTVTCPGSIGNCSSDLRLVLPATVPVTAHVGGNGVTLVGMRGGVDVATSGGDVTGSGLGGRATATSSGGDVSLDFGTQPVRVAARSSGGDVGVFVPDGSGPYRVDARSSGGSTDVQVSTSPTAGPVVDVTSSGGNVLVGYR